MPTKWNPNWPEHTKQIYRERRNKKHAQKTQVARQEKEPEMDTSAAKEILLKAVSEKLKKGGDS